MMPDNEPLKKVADLCQKKFFIPSYQRGYRWKRQQVKDLLDDIWEFHGKGCPGFYCLQPLIVTKKIVTGKEEDWVVIDGQQRLTTIFLIISFLRTVILFLQKDKTFCLSYETRPGSEEFLNNIAGYNNDSESNIDFFHMKNAYETIKAWFQDKNEELAAFEFEDTLFNHVQVIWYEVVKEVPTHVFTRLNIGKIALTNAELIKALLLNSSNWQKTTDSNAITLRQQEIASQWDSIEYTLQNKEFWMFIHDKSYNNPTRIELLFEYICRKDRLRCKTLYEEEIGDDKYKTFRYFSLYIQLKKEEKEECLKKIWDETNKIFNTLQEWYADCELFHYIGFLIETKGKNEFDTLLDTWYKTASKEAYTGILKEKIKKCIGGCSCLSKQYELGENPTPKQASKPLLLLFNIQSVIEQNKSYSHNEQYQAGVFYKFPFHLYKSEHWDIEHIDSNTENTLTTPKDREEWVLNALYAHQAQTGELKLDEKLKENIVDYHQKNWNINQNDFNSIQARLNAIDQEQTANQLSPEEKNQIWNFALLDRGTNRGYHNDMYPTKRRKLLDKEQGAKEKKLKLNTETFKIETEEGQKKRIAFVPPCTRNVFTKCYTPGKNDSWSWTKRDAECYRQAIFNTLNSAGFANVVITEEGSKE